MMKNHCLKGTAIKEYEFYVSSKTCAPFDSHIDREPSENSRNKLQNTSLPPNNSYDCTNIRI